MSRQHTLIIHPEDPTTEFLKACYTHAENTTVVNGPISPYELDQLIDVPHQRIVLLGHGTPGGLLNVRGFLNGTSETFAVGISHTSILRNNPENIMIFCYAHTFGLKNKIRGFRSDMFISEPHEAWSMGIKEVNPAEITFSNQLFAGLVGEKINQPAEEIYQHVIKHYGGAASKNRIIRYNHERLFLV